MRLFAPEDATYRCKKCRRGLFCMGDVYGVVDAMPGRKFPMDGPAFMCTDGKKHVPVEYKPTKFLKGSFHCRYCKAPIRTDGSAFYTSQAHFPSTAYWQDHNGIFFCLDTEGEHILPHKPLTAEILASTDAILTGSAAAPVEWVDELSENDRRSFERWAGTGCLKVSEDPRVVDRLQNMPPQDF